MTNFESNGMKISAFSLGTVQLGMDYGFGDHSRKPNEAYAHSILDKAFELGVDTWDTANNYGDSESVIGHWLSKKQAANAERPTVITKIGPLDHSSPKALSDDVYRQTEKSLNTLHTDCLDMLMLHNFEDYEKNSELLSQIFEELKAQKMIKTSALSAYSRHDYRMIARSGFDAVQIPLNVFDWTRIDDGGIKAIADAGIMIFARSVYLQGLVFFRPEDIDPRMSFCVPYITAFRNLCHELQMESAVLALSFVFSIRGVKSVVLGCQTPEQVIDNCKLMDKVTTLSGEQMDRIHEAFGTIDPRVINPGAWFNHT